MASVYSNAELTVAATMAGESLFSRRDGKDHTQVDVDDTDETLIFLRRSLPHFTWQDMEYDWFESDEFVDAEREWPLLSRGWTYQEQLLSKRTLHFTRHEIIWECNNAMECECGWYMHSGILEMPGTTQKKQSVESKSWNQIVKEYSKRELTFGTDKLPALAGIAKAFSEGNDDLGQYACGMWEQQLENSFFWSLAEDPKPKPDSSSLPSWSWASVFGNVSCWEVSVENVEFLGVSVSYNGEPLMGEATEAVVTLSGPLVQATLEYGQKSLDGVEASLTTGDESPDLVSSQGGRHYRLRVGEKFSTFRPDYTLDNPGPATIPLGSPAFCLIFGRSTSSSFDPEEGITDEHTAACFLVLTPVDETNTVFRRIGLFDGSCEDGEDVWELEPLLELSQKKQVTLI
ncbi:HET domain-containing protein [Fusarium falciforme]|uniref:HET domain-containing protein n=1 Tax=Fusarium falciforme TaxID=195108 RepID=UPI0022FFC85F|nr:HET domain-containing protein [Fusarium falciforme]WAO91693.1 HET domain-containing protein [Fusarium falciforme]